MDVQPIYVPASVPGKSWKDVATHWVYEQFAQCAIRADFSMAHENSSHKLLRVKRLVNKEARVTRELAPLKKTIYSLIDLREILLECNQRDLAFLSSLDDPSAGERDLQRLSQPHVGTDPSVKGLNFFDATEQTLLRTLPLGQFNIHGWRRADLLAHLSIECMSRPFRQAVDPARG